ncbi:zinc finger, C2H2 type [Teladorsagia circumcincta]|uniref:Zinc finger, C2H2 type n=1 Tax=Teladorsagia circumcincta TaxID=45464 RepID=A0A2G9USA5_TELCI|nr:zinc finger, C2H2 type [Teladorsagia circumcincta]
MEQSNLLAHLAALHGMEGSNEAERMLLAKEKKVRCDVEGCGYIAHSDSDYRTHLRETHLFMIEKKNRRLKCPTCEKLFNTQEDLVNHCRVAHGDRDCAIQTCTFQSKEECEEIHLPNGTVVVRYCLKHVNHDLNYALLPLSKVDKTVIANYCRQSHDAETIQKMIRQEYTDPKSKLHWVTASEIRKVLSSLASSKRNKVEEVAGTSSKESVKEEARGSVNDFEESSLFASALLQPLPDKEDDSECGVISDGAVSARSPEPGIQAESLLGCSSCAKLSERVSELEAIVKRLNSRVIELEDAQLFNGIVKTERNSSQIVDNGVKQENS